MKNFVSDHSGVRPEVSTHEPISSFKSGLTTPWIFLQPTTELKTTITGSVKYYLDSLASSVGDSQCARQRRNRKRKRSEAEEDSTNQVLHLKQLYVDGFTSDQIWQQALRILDSSGGEVERDFTWWSAVSKPHERSLTSNHNVALDDTGSEGSNVDSQSEADLTGSSIDDDDDDLSSVHAHSQTSHNDSDVEEDIEKLSDNNSGSDIDDGEQETYVEDPFGLNDGFFSIDDFNKQSELLERQDVSGGPDNDSESEDDEIDWHANPLTTAGSVSLSKRDMPREHSEGNDDEDISDSEEEGPTFGDAGFEDDSDMDADDVYAANSGGEGWMNTSDIKYSDFFAPPPRKVTRKKTRSLPKTQPDLAITNDDVDRAMADVRRDLFEDELSGEDSDEHEVARGSQTNSSSHEKQRARIADEIRRLEAANVAKKEWMLAGEARAVERPVNSLIEEDLDFERIGKPVPVVTAELSEDIEELVKRRILAKQFDEVIRRRPGVSDAQRARGVRPELEDTKPQQSLAELYEADHLRATDPNFVDPKNQKLIREHATVTSLWKEISSQLDTLSNWHYKPKAPQASINVVTDVATITMEDAQPTASNAVNGTATLAPQEIYAPGDDNRVAGEMILKNGTAIAKEEMTREQKARLRREHKKQIASTAKSQKTGKAAENQQLISDLKKGGVKLIGKQGEVTNINGGKIKEAVKEGGHVLKL
ncbi:rRNA-processing protein MPP10 [Aspergillus vadensis CBS 113365]|uniref:U3 small nucleolar ribonucleoprotein protein MPP10 n=1 Tax=Aspergillus vadensis (strain CBS 113365 / IMI 142717 / IBT 24658) TaxID=1448311 RepID=A0A319CFD8_ASPVC|nr:U3 small nucleolar ribonucleo protein Mpp10 [Aspergillus vadensis CBS 113365]PYH74028.1 U3 small nucleolar ribonucleo protein Mpp10 [Aspergillus vadensis CBS 113365]